MMKKMIALVLAALLCLGCCAVQAEEELPIVAIVQLVQHTALDAAREGFVQALADNGYVDGETIKLDYRNANNDMSNLATIADGFVAENASLVLAIATSAVTTMASKTETIPILGTAVTDYIVANLVESNEVPGVNVSGTSDMNPVAAQIELVKTFVPDAKKVGVLYNSGEDNSVLQAQLAKEAIEALGMEYVEVTVTSSNEVQQATQQIVEMCDAIYLPTDNVFASSMPMVYGVTVESKTPVICGEEGMVQGGGLVTLGINYYDLGYQTGEMAIEVLNGADVSTMPIQFAKGFTYSVNKTVADEIGVEIPEELAEYAFEMTTEEAAE